MKTEIFPPDLDFEYLPQIAFRSVGEQEEILARGRELLRLGRIPEVALEFGKKYREMIALDFCPEVSVRLINERVGHGVYAENRLEADQYIGEYTGIVRENEIYFVPMNNYCYEYPVPDRIGRSFVIDATKGNFTRFINHSARPNLKPVYAFVDGFYHVVFISLRVIEKGEHLSYDYGSRYWYIRSAPEEISTTFPVC